MVSSTTPYFLSGFLENSFNFKHHVQDFLDLDPETVETKLAAEKEEIKNLGHEDFNWQEASTFYRDKVGEFYLFELGAWHLSSHEYIGDMLRLIADSAQGRVLDFGGGIRTHALGAALCPQVEQVIYYDINPINCDFVQYRSEKMDWKKNSFCS
ncbi:hypothetical protein [uncultured Nostoc sp.]|uniref:hypothetical protein n=1 Tax=uncultured Nostoc sp. TaxID=340711 RepID=UPI0035CBD039